MPHINIKHFPVELDESTRVQFVQSITSTIKNTFGCNEEAISIAIEPVDSKDWDDQVYTPEIIQRERWLQKRPGYGTLAENK